MTDSSRNYQIFISHSTKDKDIAWDLSINLEKTGFKCWIAPRDIPAGQKYESAIMEGIESCPVMLLVCSSNIEDSDYVIDEINAAKRRGKLIISVITQEGYSFNPVLEFLLSRYQWIDMWDGGIKAHLKKITDAVAGEVKPSVRGDSHLFRTTTEAGDVSSVQSVQTDGGFNSIDSIRKAAARGDAWSQYILARMHGSGYTINSSYSEAVRLYRQASSGGHLMARSVLHSLVPSEDDVSDDELGQWLDRNYDKFLMWAEEGNPIAQCDIGWMFQYGRGRRQSYKDAVEWYRRSAGQGYARAQNIMGVLHRDGLGVEKSYENAISNFKRAADQGYARAQYHLALMHHKGQGVEASDSTAVSYLKSAADQGHPMAQNFLGYMYQNGLGVDASDVTAVMWYTESANKGFVYGQYNLGVMYLDGRGIDRSMSMARKWFEKASEQNHPGATYNLGVFYEHGYECESSETKALELFKKASDLGSEEARSAFDDLKSKMGR